MGFQVEYQVERWTRSPGFAGSAPQTDLRPLKRGEIGLLDHWDSRFFGASRRTLLRWYLGNGQPFLAWGDPVSGFVAGRQGSHAFQIGPLVASEPAVADSLLTRALSLVNEKPAIADVLTPNPEIGPMLTNLGFRRFRILQRMFRGSNRHPGRPEKVYCAAGFEYG